MKQIPKSFKALTSNSFPALNLSEMDSPASPEIIHAEKIMDFSPQGYIDKINSKTGFKGLALECGGNSIRGSEFVVEQDGSILTNQAFQKRLESKDSEGYVALLEEFADYARVHELPVGIAFGGPINGTIPITHPKFSHLIREVNEKYDGDLANVFKGTRLEILNDGAAGLVSGAIEARKVTGSDSPVFYLINGGGVGIGAYNSGTIFSTEAGHLPVPDKLNVFGANRPCGVYGDHTCFENIVSNKRGIEAEWLNQTSQKLSGREIEDKLLANDDLAHRIFELTALAQATLLAFTADALSVDLSDPNTAVVFHGGANKTPSLKERTAQILWQEEEIRHPLILTSDYHENACEVGVAQHLVAKS
jgi:predicted NBD/HSP70 family sugar kinase